MSFVNGWTTGALHLQEPDRLRVAAVRSHSGESTRSAVARCEKWWPLLSLSRGQLFGTRPVLRFPLPDQRDPKTVGAGSRGSGSKLIQEPASVLPETTEHRRPVCFGVSGELEICFSFHDVAATPSFTVEIDREILMYRVLPS